MISALTSNYEVQNEHSKLSNSTTECSESESQTEPDNGFDMKRETDRLRTYQGWPCPFLTANNMAKAGFYFLKRKDIVRCAFCPIEIEKWEEGDDPMDCHRKLSPMCPFVTQNPCGNIPAEPPSPTGEDTCGKYGIEVRQFSLPEDEPSSSTSKLNYSKLGIFNNRGPAYPYYSVYERRLESFTEWPKSMKQKPNELAAAGFYYTGKGDQTVCFHCGGGLKDWEDNDDPWEQHALWFRKCNFLLLQKGQEFISEIYNGKKQQIAMPGPSTECSSSKNTMEKPVNNTNISVKPDDTKTKEITEESCKTTSNSSSNTLCKICYNKEVGVVFLPCGHLVACVDCAPALNRCAVCRKPLEATVRAYVS